MRIQSNQNTTKLSFKMYRLRQIEKTYGYMIDPNFFLFQNTSSSSFYFTAIGKNIPRFMTSICQILTWYIYAKAIKTTNFGFFYCCCYTYYVHEQFSHESKTFLGIGKFYQQLDEFLLHSFSFQQNINFCNI